MWSGEGAWIITKLVNLSDEDKGIAKAQIPWNLLSLANGVDLSEFMIQTVIGFEKYQARFPTCGGKPQISVITPTEYRIVKPASDFEI